MDSNILEYKLFNVENLDIKGIRSSIQNGAKFIIFKYTVSILVITFSRLSPAILINSTEEFKNYKKKYNIITFLFGLWQIPYGFMNVFKTIKFNNEGAFDATKDILLNLETYNKTTQTVAINQVHTLFNHLPKHEFRELVSAIKEYCLNRNGINEVYVGIYINVDTNSEKPYCLGIDTSVSIDLLENEIKPRIYKKFKSSVPFEIFSKTNDEALFEKIVEQGQLIMKS